jgi:transmembrane sensor
MYIQDPYLHFQLFDFVWDEAFRLDVLDSVNGNQQFDKWVKKYPEKSRILDQARILILSMQTEECLFGADESQQLLTDTRRLIEGESEQKNNYYFGVGNLVSFRRLSAAAVVLFVFISSFYIIQYFSHQSANAGIVSYYKLVSKSTVSLNEESNFTNFPRIVKLPDGSTVTLSKKSRISYPKDFQSSSARLVYLTGEAFFDVTRNPQHPFYVHTDGLAVRVLGTSFRVSSYDSDKEVIVEVQTGKVSVFSNLGLSIGNPKKIDELSSIVLVPNQKVSYSKQEASFIKTLVNEPRLIHLEKEVTNGFYFQDDAISKVFTVLQEAYGVEIVFDEELLSACTLNANLEGFSLYEQLNFIAKALNGTYEVLDGRVVFSARGCRGF